MLSKTLGLAALLCALGCPGSRADRESDAAFLKRITVAVSRLNDKKASIIRFERTVTAADARRAQRAIGGVKPNGPAYADLSFVQAYYGLDYARNLTRLMRPYRLWRNDVEEWVRQYPAEQTSDTFDGLEMISIALNYLYLKHHDSASLGAWLDMKLDGASAEVSADTLGELWSRHSRDLLKAATSKARQRNLASALNYSRVSDNSRDIERTNKQNLLNELRQFQRDRSPAVAAHARSVIKAVQSIPISR